MEKELMPNQKAMFKRKVWEWCMKNKEEAIKLGLLIEIQER